MFDGNYNNHGNSRTFSSYLVSNIYFFFFGTNGSSNLVLNGKSLGWVLQVYTVSRLLYFKQIQTSFMFSSIC